VILQHLRSRIARRLRSPAVVAIPFVVVSLSVTAGAAENSGPAGYKLLYSRNFTSPQDLAGFVMTDPAAWRVTKTNDVTALDLFTQSKYKPAYRSPFNIALIADKVFGDFVLEADLMQTSKEYGHRDMCLFFGVQDPSHLYYAHLATAADEHAHNIFVFTNAPRIKIAEQTTKGIDWGQGVWHKIRLERHMADGAIKVFYDDLAKPLMIAHDKTLPSGYVGFGSFDDTGMIANIRVWGPSVEARKTEFFKRPASH